MSLLYPLFWSGSGYYGLENERGEHVVESFVEEHAVVVQRDENAVHSRGCAIKLL